MSLFYIILAVVAVLFAAWWLVPAVVLYRRRCRLGRELPGWSTYFLLGNIPQFLPLETMADKWRDYIAAERHKMTRTWLGPFKLFVNVHHSDIIREIHNKIPKSELINDLLCGWLGDGLLLASGDRWRRNRKLLTPAFHFKILEPYVTVYDKCAQVLVKRWTVKSRRGEPVNLFRSMRLLSLDIILKCAFSYESNCQEAADGKQERYVDAVYELCDLTFDRLFNPLYSMRWLYDLSSAGRREKQLCDLVHRHAEKIIQERRRALGLETSQGAAERKEIFTTVAKQSRYLDFLDILLSSEDDQGVGLSDLEIRDEVDTFMFEGHDTTATGMGWTLYCLAKHPEHQEKVRDEVNRVLSTRDADHLTHENLKELHYTTYCIKEALRLYPPVPAILRRTDSDMEVGGYNIPKGTDVTFALQSIHRHPDVWDDPEVYNPLRFAPEAVKKPDPFAFLAFSVGSRNCIGQNFAMNEMKVVLGILVQKFRFSLEDDNTGSDPKVIPAIILRPKHSILLRVEEI